MQSTAPAVRAKEHQNNGWKQRFNKLHQRYEGFRIQQKPLPPNSERFRIEITQFCNLWEQLTQRNAATENPAPNETCWHRTNRETLPVVSQQLGLALVWLWALKNTPLHLCKSAAKKRLCWVFWNWNTTVQGDKCSEDALNIQYQEHRGLHGSPVWCKQNSPSKRRRSLRPADFGNVVVLSQGVQVPVEVLRDRGGTKHSGSEHSPTLSPPHSAAFPLRLRPLNPAWLRSPQLSACGFSRPSSGSSPFAVRRHDSTVISAWFRARPTSRVGRARQADLPASPASSRRPLVLGSACPGRASSPLPASYRSRSAPGSGPCPSLFSSSCGQTPLSTQSRAPAQLPVPPPSRRSPLPGSRPRAAALQPQRPALHRLVFRHVSAAALSSAPWRQSGQRARATQPRRRGQNRCSPTARPELPGATRPVPLRTDRKPIAAACLKAPGWAVVLLPVLPSRFTFNSQFCS